jgi:hypothetical protein
VRFHELAAEVKAIAFALAVPHADLDGIEVIGVIARTDGEKPADRDLVRNREAQAASRAVEHQALKGLLTDLEVGNEDLDGVAAPAK